jgi:hypothetical protein
MSISNHPVSRLAAAFFCLGAISAALAQPAEPAAPVEYPRSQLETEQRIMRANIDDANYHINRGINAVSAGLPELAKVSMLRATGRVAQIESLMKDHPERIERVAMVLFTPREEVRKPLRASFEKIRDDFGALEQAMYAFRKDMLRKGIFGEELKEQVAVLDSVTKILPGLKQQDPALAAKVSSLVDQINEALANGDTAKAAELITQLESMLKAAGKGDAIESAKDQLNAQAGPPAPAAPAAPTTPPAPAEAAAAVIAPAAAAAMPAAPAPGSKVTESADSITITDPVTGETRTIPKSFFHGNEATVYETQYIGGEGQKLTAERELKVSLKQDAAGHFTGADQTTGREREWDFAIAETPGARKFADDGSGMATQLVFADTKRKTDFKIAEWVIKNPAGQEVGRFGAQDKVDFKFKDSGVHTVSVSGETDWGNKFTVSVDIKVAL